MLQSLSPYAPWGGRIPQFTSQVEKKKRRARRAHKTFAGNGNAGHMVGPTSPTQDNGALPSHAEEEGGLQLECEYDETGSDVENPLVSRRSPRGVIAGLYGHKWCLGTDSHAPTSLFDTASFVSVSTLLNILLLAFLLWTRAEPRCADVWIPFQSQQTMVHTDHVAPAVSTMELPMHETKAAVGTVAWEQPPEVSMPPLIALPTVDDDEEDELPTKPSSPPSPAKAASKKPAPAAPAALTPEQIAAAKAKQRSIEEAEEAQMAQIQAMVEKMQQEEAAKKKKDGKGKQIPSKQTPSAKPAEQPKKQASAPAAPSTAAAPAALPADALKGQLRPLFSDQVAGLSASREAVEAFQRDFSVDQSHKLTWNACAAALVPPPDTEDESQSLVGVPPQKWCPETSKNEQAYQLEWFGSHVVGAGARRFVPKFLSCVHLPPQGYRWPEKHPVLPYDGGAEGPGAVHWPNLRVATRQELVEFNKHTPKNLFHFDAHVYDQDGLAEMALAAKYIPLKDKVRLMLDIGAGGGSLGVLLKRAYDITTVATAFADWPYCEYMTERGELCMLVDVMEAMPFAKSSFDLIHVSWVYHGQTPRELWDMMHEVDRVLRWGGYMYLRGGWSHSQIIAQRSMLAQLGYTCLYEQIQPKPAEVTESVSFGPELPYEADWVAIYLKPIKATPAPAEECKARVEEEERETVALPLKERNTPTQQGNVYEE